MKKEQVKMQIGSVMTEIDETETWLNRQIEKRIFKYFDDKDLLKKGRYYD